ncbi:MAG: hypothetical protein M1353_07925 [Nitrospirae bacterium]|nr:hypothetical protein [Nitrospirota bacterium]
MRLRNIDRTGLSGPFVNVLEDMTVYLFKVVEVEFAFDGIVVYFYTSVVGKITLVCLKQLFVLNAELVF